MLAAVILPMALVTANRGLRGPLRRATSGWPGGRCPIWMYVSVTGVVIYLMLYQLY